ncbi:MAG: TFIIB-type zinc finger domain-containing protein [Bacteroidales bacterium]|nr:TFIIB-type zinc finger domain-containing protein [Bacteroidales bacterium]
MKVIKCELCGGTELIKQDGFFVCQSCGTKYTLEEARKMMVEVEGDDAAVPFVKEQSSELKNLYEIARRAKDSDNNENAHKYYDMIMVKDPSSWEANFYVVYFKAMSCKIAEIASAGTSVEKSLTPVLSLVQEGITDEEEQKKVISEIYSRCSVISTMLSNGALNHYQGIGDSIRAQYTQEYINNASSAADIMYTLGNLLIEKFGDTYGTIAASSWEDGIKIHNTYLKYLNDKDSNKNLMTKYAEKIKKFNPSYSLPAFNTGNTGGCYIATAVYGSYDCPEVWTLRRFRDDSLQSTWYGRAFIKAYYAISPQLVKWFGDTKWFKNLWKRHLDRMVNSLKEKGFSSMPYIDN